MEKTPYLKLNKDARTDAYSVDRVNENTDKIDEFAKQVESNFNLLKQTVNNIDLTDTKITCTSKDNQKLNEVITGITSYMGEIPTLITNAINMISATSVGDTLENLLQKMAKKGEILPQDVKGNSDKRLYKYVVITDRDSDNPYLWVEYVNDKGSNVTDKYYLKDLKLIKDIKADIETNKSKISALESENASLKREMSELKSMIETNNNRFATLNNTFKAISRG